MSLILYGDTTERTTGQDENDDDQFKVILYNRFSNTLVLHNRYTDELILMNNNNNNGNSMVEVEKTCPHCGSMIKVDTEINTAHKPNIGTNQTSDKEDLSSIHANYFKLLGNSIAIDTRETTPSFETFGSEDFTFQNEHYNNLPSSIFQQGYFSNFFKLRELLGKGSRGFVFKVEHFLNDVSLGVFALKKITIGDDPKWLLKVLNEVNMLVKISYNNKNLVNYNHVWLEVDSINDFGPKVPCAFILQQYCSGGSLESFVHNIKNPILTVKEMKQHHIKKLQGRYLTNEEILVIFTDLVNGVAELHKNHIIHRDLKPSNCLMAHPYLSKFELAEVDLDRIPTALIGDFGESQLEGELRTASGYTGTIEYTAPELFMRKNQFSKKTDVYSLGMILYFLCFSGIPFQQTTNLDLLKEEIKNFHIDDQSRSGDILPDLVDLIKLLTSKDPKKRPDTLDILKMLEHISRELQRDTAPTEADDTSKDQGTTGGDPLINKFDTLSGTPTGISPTSHELLDDHTLVVSSDGENEEGEDVLAMKRLRDNRIKTYFDSEPKLLKLFLVLSQICLLRYVIIPGTPEFTNLHYGIIFWIGFGVRESVRECLFLALCVCCVAIFTKFIM